MERPWLSVIMPTYNGEAFLESALESILSQGDRGIEIIAVDDGSSDSTIRILESYRGKLPLRLFERGRIGNWVANTNYGLKQARGDHVCFLHQDDLWLDGRLSTMKSMIAESRSAVMFLHPSWFIDSDGRRVGHWRCPLPGGGELEPAFVAERLLVQNFIAMPAPLFSREVALKVGGLDEELWYTADWDFWLKVAGAGRTVYHPRALSAFRIHPLSQTAVRSDRNDDFRNQLEIVLERHLKGWESSRASGRVVRRVARYSVEVNIALAALVHGQASSLPRLFAQSLGLGPSAWLRYLRDSRILERVLARQWIAQAKRHPRP
jgi:hypothetical protein